jgi:hypothetical protein
VASDAPVGLRNENFNRCVLFFHLYPQMSHMAKSDWLATICHDNSRLPCSSVEYSNEQNSLSSALATSWLWRIWTSFRALNVSKFEHLVTVNLTFSCDTTRYHGHKCRAPQIDNPVHFYDWMNNRTVQHQPQQHVNLTAPHLCLSSDPAMHLRARQL